MHRSPLRAQPPRFLGLGCRRAQRARWFPSRAFAAAVPTAAFALADAPERSFSFVHTHTERTARSAYCAGGRLCPARAGRRQPPAARLPRQRDQADRPESARPAVRAERRLGTEPAVPRDLRLPHAGNQRDAAGARRRAQRRRQPQPAHGGQGDRHPRAGRRPRAPARHGRSRCKIGGVGFYAASDFVHVDTGRVRYW